MRFSSPRASRAQSNPSKRQLKHQRAINWAVDCIVEQLEDRRLLSVSLQGATLDIVAPAPGSDITVTQSGSTLSVNINGATSSFSTSDVQLVSIQAGDGNARVDATKTSIDDIITGGTGNQTLAGGSGNDTLIAGAGNDLLFAQSGANTIWANGNDHVIGGDGGNSIVTSGTDNIVATAGRSHIHGGNASDTISQTDTPSVNGNIKPAASTVTPDGARAARRVRRSHAAPTTPPPRVKRFKPGPVTPNYPRGNFVPPVATYASAPDLFANAPPAGVLTPNQIRNGYDMNMLTIKPDKRFPKFTNTGVGQQIVIVDAYDDPNIQADLNAFCKFYGLPGTTVNVAYAGGGQPIQDPFGGWEMEEALDVEWAHVMAPSAQITLVEAQTALPADLLTGIQLADTTIAGSGGVVSMSWGGPEQFNQVSAYDAEFSSPANAKITFVSSAGDVGAIVSYPSTSPYVVSVGGTNLVVDAAGVRTAPESAWINGGGGPSGLEPLPPFQTGITVGTGGPLIGPNRGTPDVSLNADNVNSPVAIFDTIPDLFGDTGWAAIGGTSESTADWAGIFALGNELRASLGQAPVGGSADNLLYNVFRLDPADYHDITTGFTLEPPASYNALPGWDFATGIGTPDVDKLLPTFGGFFTSAMSASATFTDSLATPIPLPVFAQTNFQGGGSDPANGVTANLTMAFLTTDAQDPLDNLVMSFNRLHFKNGYYRGSGVAVATVDTDPTQNLLTTFTFNVNVVASITHTGKTSGQFYAVDAIGNKINQGLGPDLQGTFSAG